MKQDKLSNFIPISRDIFEHEFWKEKREFSRYEAWMYLLKEARFEDSRVLDGNNYIEVNRGQIYASIRFIANAIGWGKKRTENFLQLLINEEMIKKETAKETGQTLITICKYDVYNASEHKKETAKETARRQQGDSRETAGRQQGDSRETAGRQQGDSRETKSNIENKDNIVNKDNILKEPKTFFLNGVQVAISENYHKALDEMQNDGAWIETNTINLRMIDRTLTPDRLKEKIIEFFVLRTNEGNIDTPTTQSMKQHFANWLRQDLSKQNKQLNNEQPQIQRIQRDPHLERMAELRRRATGIRNDNK